MCQICSLYAAFTKPAWPSANEIRCSLSPSTHADFISWIKSHAQHKYAQLIFGCININLGDKSNITVE